MKDLSINFQNGEFISLIMVASLSISLVVTDNHTLAQFDEKNAQIAMKKE